MANKVDAGVEGQGGFDDGAAHEGLLGIYFDATERITLNVGAGTGLGDEGPDFTLRTALVWLIY